MRCAAVIVAAGRGSRFGGEQPKQYLPLAGRPLLCRTVATLAASEAVDELVLVVAAGEQERAEQLVAGDAGGKPLAIVAGGNRRADSVERGLGALGPTTDLALIHDAARPLVSRALIARVVEVASRTGAALAATPARDAIKLAGEGQTVARTLAREGLFLAQTPQAFRCELLRRAFAGWHADGEPEVGDDAELVERIGSAVSLVAGEPRNLKLTVPDDLPLVEALLAQRGHAMNDARIGTGYDLHRLAEGPPLVLGGVPVPHHAGLLGHSDADVLTHAVADALLGAAALGDLGQHFPAEDPQLAGADSIELLARVVRLVAARRLTVANVDAVVICEQPRLAPFTDEMRRRLATALDVAVERVSVKATSGEGLGWCGRGEGIAAQAVALLVPAP